MENEPHNAYLPSSDDEAVQPFDVREQSSGAGMYKLLGVLVFLAVLGVVVLKLFASGTRDRDATPRILAQNKPYKEVPIERGGEQTPNQDKEIYQVLNGTKTDAPVKTSPVAETPLAPPKSANTPNTKPAANIVIKEPNTGAGTAPKVVIKPKPTHVYSNYVVQVASLRSRTDAAQKWARLNKAVPDLFSPEHVADIKRVEIEGRGIYYRLRIGGLTNKAAATRLCARLKARKQECIVTTK